VASSAAQRTFVNVKIRPSKTCKLTRAERPHLIVREPIGVRNDGFSLEGTRHAETGCTPSSPLLPPRLR
jgi:hypothetical protein